MPKLTLSAAAFGTVVQRHTGKLEPPLDITEWLTLLVSVTNESGGPFAGLRDTDFSIRALRVEPSMALGGLIEIPISQFAESEHGFYAFTLRSDLKLTDRLTASNGSLLAVRVAKTVPDRPGEVSVYAGQVTVQVR